MAITKSAAIRIYTSRLSIRAQRTAFLARFIVLRESRRSRAHRKIEALEWSDSTTAWDLAKMIVEIFKNNGDKVVLIERDINRALMHAEKLPLSLYQEYSMRSTLSFVDALKDYELSNSLLFAEGQEEPKLVGWQPAMVIDRVLTRNKILAG